MSRRLFAPSFVVTLAALPIACAAGADKRPQTPTQPEPQAKPTSASPSVAATEIAAPAGSGTIAVAPTASSAVIASPAERVDHWTLLRSADKCTAVPIIDCTGASPCPGSQPYDCPKGVPRYPAYLHRKGGTCIAMFARYEPMKCPPTSKCNPPSPTYDEIPAECPKP